jgi:hypothetical protein
MVSDVTKETPPVVVFVLSSYKQEEGPDAEIIDMVGGEVVTVMLAAGGGCGYDVSAPSCLENVVLVSMSPVMVVVVALS